MPQAPYFSPLFDVHLFSTFLKNKPLRSPEKRFYGRDSHMNRTWPPLLFEIALYSKKIGKWSMITQNVYVLVLLRPFLEKLRSLGKFVKRFPFCETLEKLKECKPWKIYKYSKTLSLKQSIMIKTDTKCCHFPGCGWPKFKCISPFLRPLFLPLHLFSPFYALPKWRRFQKRNR